MKFSFRRSPSSLCTGSFWGCKFSFFCKLCMSTGIFWTTKKIYEAISLTKKAWFFSFVIDNFHLSAHKKHRSVMIWSIFWYPRDQKPQHNDIICTRVRPLLTKSITSGIISCAGSCIAQVATQPQGAWWQTDNDNDHLMSVIWVLYCPGWQPA